MARSAPTEDDTKCKYSRYSDLTSRVSKWISMVQPNLMGWCGMWKVEVKFAVAHDDFVPRRDATLGWCTHFVSLMPEAFSKDCLP